MPQLRRLIGLSGVLSYLAVPAVLVAQVAGGVEFYGALDNSAPITRTEGDVISSLRRMRFVAMAMRHSSNTSRPWVSSSRRRRSANVCGLMVPRSFPSRERTDNKFAATSLSPATNR